MQKAYAIVMFKEMRDGEERWSAMHPELPGCAAGGRTKDEARANLNEIREEWIKLANELGRNVPAPRSHGSITINYTAGTFVTTQLGTDVKTREERAVVAA